MNRLQRLCAAVVLTVASTLTASAGEISTGLGVPPPPPPPSSMTAQGDMHFPVAGAADGEAAADPLAQVMLGLLHSVLTLL